jgi:hypothetical protein
MVDQELVRDTRERMAETLNAAPIADKAGNTKLPSTRAASFLIGLWYLLPIAIRARLSQKAGAR